MTENVFLVRIEAADTGHAYRFLVGIECGLHQLTKHDSAQQFAQSAFLAKYTSLREITIFLPELYGGDDFFSLPKMDQGCGCWVAEI